MRALSIPLLLVAGCGSGGDACTANCATDDLSVSRDLSAPAGPDLQAPDLATPDLATPSDLTVPPDFYGYTLCANTMAASTCVQTFFQQVVSCFPVPMSNPCTLD